MWARMCLNNDGGYIQEPLVKYRMRSQNYTKSFTKEKKLQGHAQIARVKHALLQQYFASSCYQDRLLMNNDLASVYQEIIFIHFSQGRLKEAHEIASQALWHGVRSFSVFKYYLLSFLSAEAIGWLRKK